MVATVPEACIATMSKAKRNGKIFVDYFRNDYTATAIADYAVRSRPGAPVALPLDWEELNTLKSAGQFTLRDVLKQTARKIWSSRTLRFLPLPASFALCQVLSESEFRFFRGIFKVMFSLPSVNRPLRTTCDSAFYDSAPPCSIHSLSSTPAVARP